MFRAIKRRLPERYKGPLVAWLRPTPAPELESLGAKPKVVVALAGFYQNLGDMALTYSQKRFIQTTLPGHDVVLFNSTHSYARMRALKSSVGPADVITTIGGGNMDDIYTSLEDARRYVVRSFPQNSVISFPQTIAFSDTPEGERALARSARTYSKHKNLAIFAREPRSLEVMEERFAQCRVEYCPDIVLSLELDNSAANRSGLMICVRDDKERKLTTAERDLIHKVVHSKSSDVIEKDTVDVAVEDCQPETFEKTLEDFWDLLRSRKVVITDRLHCMIFCAITQTPCVVLPNSNHKIRGTYETWLSHLPHLVYMNELDTAELGQAIDHLHNLNTESLPTPSLSDHFEALRQSLLEASGRV